MKTSLALAAAAFLSLAAPLLADDYILLDQRADEFDNWQERVDYTDGDPVVSREFGVPVPLLEEQRNRTHLGYGGLMIANALARETGRSFDEIVAMKQSGMGWGRIAKENGVKLGPIVSHLNRADGEFKKVKIKSNHGNSKNKIHTDHREKKSHGHSSSKGKADGGHGGGKGKKK